MSSLWSLEQYRREGHPERLARRRQSHRRTIDNPTWEGPNFPNTENLHTCAKPENITGHSGGPHYGENSLLLKILCFIDNKSLVLYTSQLHQCTCRLISTYSTYRVLCILLFHPGPETCRLYYCGFGTWSLYPFFLTGSI